MKNNIGLQFRRKGRVLELHIDLNLNGSVAIKTMRAIYEVEQAEYFNSTNKENPDGKAHRRHSKIVQTRSDPVDQKECPVLEKVASA
jgi:hypothetical protein